MPAPINVHVYSDALVLLGTAGVVIPLVRRFGLNPVLGYLGAGAILGPLGLGSFIGSFPFLYWLTVVDAKNVSGFADLGIVFLLFLIGMELSYERLKSMRRLVFGLGGSQIALSTAVIGGIAALAGNKPPVALILGACLALSSTAIVVEVLSRQGRLNTHAGRASFATLLAQDLAVVPLLLFISIFGTGEAGSVVATLILALTNAALALCSDRHRWPRRDASALPSGRISRHERLVRGHDAVRDRRNRGGRRRGRVFDGAWRLCRRLAACRD